MTTSKLAIETYVSPRAKKNPIVQNRDPRAEERDNAYFIHHLDPKNLPKTIRGVINVKGKKYE